MVIAGPDYATMIAPKHKIFALPSAITIMPSKIESDHIKFESDHIK